MQVGNSNLAYVLKYKIVSTMKRQFYSLLQSFSLAAESQTCPILKLLADKP